MQVCQRLQEKLDSVWGKLQTEIVENQPGISQIDCDEYCTNLLEERMWSEIRELQAERILSEHGCKHIDLVIIRIRSTSDLFDGYYDRTGPVMKFEEYEKEILKHWRMLKRKYPKSCT